MLDALRRQLLHRRHEAIAALGHRFDVLLSYFAVAKRLPKREDVLRQIGVFDKAVRPELLHQYFFFDQMTAAFEEKEQRLKGLWREGNGLAIAQEQTFGRVHAEGTELV